jgi:hypothetical protein
VRVARETHALFTSLCRRHSKLKKGKPDGFPFFLERQLENILPVLFLRVLVVMLAVFILVRVRAVMPVMAVVRRSLGFRRPAICLPGAGRQRRSGQQRRQSCENESGQGSVHGCTPLELNLSCKPITSQWGEKVARQSSPTAAAHAKKISRSATALPRACH